MKICEHCGFNNPNGITICLRCAASLERTCQACGVIVPEGNVYCGKCGARIVESPPELNKQYNLSADIFKDKILTNIRSINTKSLEPKIAPGPTEVSGIRLEATVLMIDLTSKTEDLAVVDRERTFLAANEVLQFLAEVIYRYEGTIEKYLNGGMIALFGVPSNHENDPERAVRAAFEVQQEMIRRQPGIHEKYGSDLQLRIGVNTGSIITRMSKIKHHVEYNVVGNTITLATQLISKAAPGQVLVSFSTFQRTNPFVIYKRLGNPNLEENGSDEAVIYELLSLRDSLINRRGVPGKLLPMIGRSRDKAILKDAFRQVVETGSGQVILCSGEAGIGKSRLIAELASDLAGENTYFFKGTCTSFTRIAPYQIIVTLLRSIFGISETDSDGIQKAAVLNFINNFNLDPAEVVTPLLHVLGLPHMNPDMAVRFRLLEPSMMQKEIFLSLRKVLLAIEQYSPMVLVFDDLHWADRSSAQFLNYFCRSLDQIQILTVLIGRDFTSPEGGNLIYSAAQTLDPKPVEIHLEPLSPSDIRLLLDQFISESSPAARTLKQTLTERAGGNPYFVEELVRYLIDNRGLELDGDQYRLLPNAHLLLDKAPGALQDIFLARLDQLSDTLREVIQKASVLNNLISPHLLSIVWPENEETINAILNELVDREFLTEIREGNENGFVFKHPLLQMTIYQTLLKRDAQKYHDEIAQAIESGQIVLSGNRDETLAFNFVRSQDPSRAIPYLVASAENAAQHFSNETAVEYYQQAISLMENSPTISANSMYSLRIGLGRALKFLGDFSRGANILEGVLQPLLERLGPDPVHHVVTEGLTELADLRIREGNLDQATQLLNKGLELLGNDGRDSIPTLWRRLIERLAWVNFRQGNLEEAHNLAELALFKQPLQEAEDPITVASLYNTLGGVYWSHTRYPEAIESVEHSLSIHRSLGYHWGIAAALNNLGVLYFSMNLWLEAFDRLEQADKIRSDCGFDPERPVNLRNIGEVLFAMGENAAARSSYNSGLEICQRFGINQARAHLELGLGRLALMEENAAEAVQHLRNASQFIDLPDEISDRSAYYYMLNAQISMQENELDLALESAKKALSIAENGDLSDERVDSYRILGMAHSAAGLFEQAETYLTGSIQLSQQNNDRYGEGQGLYEAAKMFLAWSQKDPDVLDQFLHQAERLLGRAIRLFETLGAKRDLQHSQALNMNIGSLKQVPVSLPASDDFLFPLDPPGSHVSMPAGEWYQASVFYMLLIPVDDVDEELNFETINYLYPFFTNIVEENGGKVIREQTGFLAIFGAPVAHEDDPEQAVGSALQIIHFYSEIISQAELPVTIQIGIALGKIIASQIGAGAEGEVIAAGEPIELAKKIAELAGSSCALVSAPVRNSTSYRYEYGSSGKHDFDQMGSHEIYQVEGLREQLLAVRGLTGLMTPLLGRDSEYKSILELSKRLGEGTGGLVWLEGEAGIGKSRMMQELSTWAAAADYFVWVGTCSNHHLDVPFALFSRVLSQVFEIRQNDTPAQIYTLIDRRLETWPAELVDTRPYLEFLLGVQPREGSKEPLLALEPEQLRRQIFVALHRIVTRLSEIQPLVIFLDDLHWIDAISADLLLYLSYLIGSQRIFLICAYRADIVSPSETTLARVRNMYPDYSLHIILKPLPDEGCYALLNELVANANLADGVKTLIVHQSGGNPYYLEEFVRMLIEQDYLRMTHGHLVANQVFEISQLNIPNSLETLIRARVDTLPVSAREILQIAAIIGYPFSSDLMANISGRMDVEPYLEFLQSRGMLKLVPGGLFWQVCHPIIEVVVNNSVLRVQRKMLHERTARILAEAYQGNESDHAEELAYHYSRSDNHSRALHFLILAGERALFRHSTEAAISNFTQASDLVTAVPGAGDDIRWRIMVGLGEANLLAGNFLASRASLQAGLDLADSPVLRAEQRAGIFRCLGDVSEKLGEYEKSIGELEKALQILGKPATTLEKGEAARIYARLGWSLFHLGNLEKAKEAVLNAISFGQASNNASAMAFGENYLGGICLRQGDFNQAIQHTRQALACWEQIGYSWGMATTLNNLGILEVTGGNIQAAVTYFEQSLALRRDMGDVEGLAIGYNNLGQLLTDQGELAQAESYFRKSLMLTRSLWMNFHTATSFIALARVLLYQGRVEEAGGELEHGRELTQGLSDPNLLSELNWIEAELHIVLADFPQAEVAAHQAELLSTNSGNQIILSAALRLIAQCQMEQGDLQATGQTLSRARQAAEAVAGDLELGRVNALAKRLYQRMGDQENARKYAALAREAFEKLSARRDLALLESFSE